MDEEKKAIAEEITEENSLWQLWRKSHKIKVSHFNRVLFWILFFIMVYVLYFLGLDNNTISSSLVHISEIGFTFSTIMLGFSTAGFTVFSSFNNTDYLVDIAYYRHPDYNLSYLKVIVCSFMNTFVVLLVLLFLCFFVILYGSVNGIASNINFFNNTIFVSIFLKSYFIILFSFFLFSMLLVKSLIFNIYKTIMISVRYDFQKKYSE